MITKADDSSRKGDHVSIDLSALLNLQLPGADSAPPQAPAGPGQTLDQALDAIEPQETGASWMLAQSAKLHGLCDYTDQSPLVKDLLNVVPAYMRENARTSIPLILNAAERQGITDTNQLAYILATAAHESSLGGSMVEKGSLHYFDKYENILGNTQPGDGYLFRGRGYVQVTGRDNYAAISRDLGLPDIKVGGKVEAYLVAFPDKLTDPDIAADALVYGMKHGAFTGLGLNDFIHGSHVNFDGARKIVNGYVKSQADNATNFANVFARVLDNYQRQSAVCAQAEQGSP